MGRQTDAATVAPLFFRIVRGRLDTAELAALTVVLLRAAAVARPEYVGGRQPKAAEWRRSSQAVVRNHGPRSWCGTPRRP
ncbi:acyl-CoA carboxylase subunit epsilon [Nocardiopsis ansamitocini]|uniref:acyl-CoA carboxylase subunit epsilon n=1 Tax=Nocardiopsis ansamitocini TaxID=1670832 RepID=UPI003D7FD540